MHVGRPSAWRLLRIRLRRSPRRIYRARVDTQWNIRSGLSLGLFIFTPSDPIRLPQRVLYLHVLNLPSIQKVASMV